MFAVDRTFSRVSAAKFGVNATFPRVDGAKFGVNGTFPRVNEAKFCVNATFPGVDGAKFGVNGTFPRGFVGNSRATNPATAGIVAIHADTMRAHALPHACRYMTTSSSRAD